MNNVSRAGIFLVILMSLCVLPVVADTATTGNGQGWFVVHCNVEWAKVYLDDKYVGQTAQSTLTVQVPASTSYKTIRVQKNGYATFTNSIKKSPSDGETVDLYTTLNLLPDTTETPVGGDVGWYVVHCNIEGAKVLFDESDRGVITRGVVYVPVYSTGTPFKEYTVMKDGFSTVSATIPTVPGKGETYDLYATLNPVTTTVTTAAKIGGDTGYYKVNCNVDGATVSFDNEEKGKISQGSLLVKVYVTGTPYKTFTVYKTGYAPFTGTIDTYPAKSETVNLNAALTAQPSAATASTTTQTQQSPLPFWICGVALVVAGAAALIIRK